ncbi:maleylpyruvate isomerase family mycothiol-dependent enzyme [Raineyella fluvialis]|uniref:Maleylpyruvate isomerase family mycothiol-dependent enzyme n=1 Tax=Raineyella fluvialis TaxID=2662261 RepID=A0A5Q2FBB3_9ACTN|nr:maleylpyruvate isomerase family mycothiol-dependent enzyme [Raineyella fluvialis]QGF23691.1 maleylpyruvate isomerase family mycothiol-dependent enzyme [Raineyella fluvialis]
MNPTGSRAEEIPLTPLDRGRAVVLAQRARLLDEVRALTPEQWLTPTECPPWRVRDMVCHVVAAMDEQRHPHLLVYHAAVGLIRHRGQLLLDALNEAQIDDRRSASVDTILADAARLAPIAFFPSFLHRVPVNDGSLPRRSDIYYLQYVIAPRDVWMHRHDIARATGMSVTPDPSDTEVVVQVMRDLARSWSGPAVELVLSGSGGGTFLLGGSGPAPVVALDVVGFLRHLSGREAGSGWLDTLPPPLARVLRDARVAF